MTGESTAKIVGVTLGVCLVCSILVSTAAVSLKTIQDENFILSTTEPSTSATVMPAKVIWKSTNINVGMLPETLSTPIPFRNRFSSPPTIPDLSGPKARLYPHIIHIRLARQ